MALVKFQKIGDKNLKFQIRFSIADNLRRQGNFLEAKKEFENILSNEEFGSNSKAIQFYVGFGAFCRECGEFERSLSLYKKHWRSLKKRTINMGKQISLV